MSLMSFAKTWGQFFRGWQDDSGEAVFKSVTRRLRHVWTDGELYYAQRPTFEAMEVGEAWKIWIPAWWDHRKGEPRLKPRQVFEGCQWAPRVGRRWVCYGCGWLGPTGSSAEHNCRRYGHCDSSSGTLYYKLPDRGIYARHLSTRIVRLGDGDRDEAAREGFPGLSWEEFLHRAFPGIPPNVEVARIAFERCEAP